MEWTMMYQIDWDSQKIIFLTSSVMILSFLFYILLFFHQSFVSDETAYLYQAKQLIYRGEYPQRWFSGRIIPILYYAFLILIFGTEIHILRLMTIPIVILGGILWFRLIRAIHDDYTAQNAMGIYLFAPITLMLSTWTMFEPFSTLFTILALNALHHWIQTKKFLSIILTGVAVGAGYLCKEDVIAIGLTIGLYLVWQIVNNYRQYLKDNKSVESIKYSFKALICYIAGGLMLYIPRLIFLGFTEFKVAAIAQSVSEAQISQTGIIVNPFGGFSITKVLLSSGYALSFLGFVVLAILYFVLVRLREKKLNIDDFSPIHWVIFAWFILETSLIFVWTIQARYFYYYPLMIGAFIFLIPRRNLTSYLLIFIFVGNMLTFTVVGERYEYVDPKMTEMVLETTDYIQKHIPHNSTIVTTYYLELSIKLLLGRNEYHYNWIHHDNNSILPVIEEWPVYIIILGLNPLFNLTINQTTPEMVAEGTETVIGIFYLPPS